MDERLATGVSGVRISPSSRIPDLFTSPPPVEDALETQTSYTQEDVMQRCLPLLSGDGGGGDDDKVNDYGLPRLDRKRHARFLHNNLGRLPAPFTAVDASRPWYFYWVLNSLVLLGEDVSAYRHRLIETVRPMQNDSGGFAGGFGQTSHLATTYAVVLALAIVGGDEAYEVIDRRALWRWLCSLKQPDGGFCMSLGGEEDVRGAYCAAVISSLLNLPLDLMPESPAWTPDHPTLYTGLAEWVRRCQTFEGGISAQPDAAEAHGAYAFCALGCLSVLDDASRAIPRYFDVPRLIAWLSSRQYAPEGGFSGRTNKLVDGCYSHWVGACWPLIEAALAATPTHATEGDRPAASGPRLPAAAQSLFSREGLIRYILCCCQDDTKRGGLRDKPGKPSDAYHSCYVLSGLSSAQHKWTMSYPGVDPIPGSRWTVSPYVDEDGIQIFDEQDRVGTAHPVYAIPEKCVDDIIGYFQAKQGF